jgi:hypothetical protein
MYCCFQVLCRELCCIIVGCIEFIDSNVFIQESHKCWLESRALACHPALIPVILSASEESRCPACEIIR